MSSFILGLFDKYVEETSKLQSHSNHTHEAQVKSLEDFQKAYEVIDPPFVCLIGKIWLLYLTSILCRSNQNQKNKSFWRTSPVWFLNTLLDNENWCVAYFHLINISLANLLRHAFDV